MASERSLRLLTLESTRASWRPWNLKQKQGQRESYCNNPRATVQAKIGRIIVEGEQPGFRDRKKRQKKESRKIARVKTSEILK